MNIWPRLKEFAFCLRDAGQGWLDDRAARTGAALAFYTALSLSPLLVIAIAVAALVYGEEAAKGELAAQIQDTVGNQGAKSVEEILAHSKKIDHSPTALTIGIVTLLFGAMGVFGVLQDAMNDIWKMQRRTRGFVWELLRQRFISFGMVLGIGFLLLVSLTLSTVVAAITTYFSSLWPAASGWLHLGDFFATLIVELLLFGMIFKVLPDVQLGWRDVGEGAVVTALLFNVGKSLIVFYLSYTGVGSSFGAAGSLVALLVWIYYSTQIMLFGAEVTKAFATRRGKQMAPTLGSQVVPGANTPVRNETNYHPEA